MDMKSKRQEKIIELVGQYEIETQAELTRLLEESGYHVTQATISRDIRELKLSKVNDSNGRQKYAFMPQDHKGDEARLARVLKEGYLSCVKAQGIIVVKTLSGMAMAVAAALDAMQLDGFAGCIAGDDTVFCALREDADENQLFETINRMANQQR